MKLISKVYHYVVQLFATVLGEFGFIDVVKEQFRLLYLLQVLLLNYLLVIDGYF
jgi:hypothetical protein